MYQLHSTTINLYWDYITVGLSCLLMIVTGGQLLNQSRPMLVNAITGGDTIRSAAMLARFAGLGGAAEFLLNPVIGRMSDRFGISF